MPLSLYWTEVSLIQQAEVRTRHVLSHKGFFFFSPPSQILYFSNTFLFNLFFYLRDTAKALIMHLTSIWRDFIRSVCLFEDYRIRSDMNINGHQLHQMQSQFDPYLQNISKKMSKPMSVYATDVNQVQTSPLCGIYLNYSA